MRTSSILTVLGIALAGAFAVGPSATAAPQSGPQPVVVTNTVPVTGTVSLAGSVTSTITGTPNVTVANAATNPVAVTSADRPTPYYHIFAAGATLNAPTGCRLVIQAISFQASDTVATVHVADIQLNTAAGPVGGHYFIPLQQTNSNGSGILTYGTLALSLIVDDATLAFIDFPNDEVGSTVFTVSGYLLPLTPGASC